MGSIGILTAGGNDGEIGGNIAHFRRLGKMAQQMGQTMALFQVNRDGSVDPYEWVGKRERYVPQPKLSVSPVLYNRIPSRPLEISRKIQGKMDEWESNGHVITNPHFLSKWELAKIWREEELIRGYLLETEQLVDADDLAHWLEERSSFYLKPISGKAGIGMMHLQKTAYGTHVREQLKGKLIDHGTMNWRELNWYLGNSRRYGRYLLQEEANVATWNGRRFDVRMLLHHKPESRFSVTGMAIRSAPLGSVTTHVPNGGSRDRIDRVFADVFGNERDVIISELVSAGEAAASAIARTPGTWTELSMDASVTPDGRPILFEANSKPMKFDERDIEQYGKRRLLDSLTSIARRMEKRYQGMIK